MTINNYVGVLLGVLINSNTLFVAQEILYHEQEGLTSDHRAYSPYWLNFAERMNYAYIQVDPIQFYQYGKEKSKDQFIESYAVSAIPGDYDPNVKYIRSLATLWMRDNTILVYKVKVSNAKFAPVINWQSADVLKANQNVKLAARFSLYSSVDRPLSIEIDEENPVAQVFQSARTFHEVDEDLDHLSNISVKTGDSAPAANPNRQKNNKKYKYLKNLQWNQPAEDNQTRDRIVRLTAQEFRTADSVVSCSSAKHPEDNQVELLNSEVAVSLEFDLRADRNTPSYSNYYCKVSATRESGESDVKSSDHELNIIQFCNEKTIVINNSRLVCKVLSTNN